MAPRPGRWRAYAEVREWYAEHFPDWPVITDSGGEHGAFNLARARNMGVWRAAEGDLKADVVVINDADTIPEVGPLVEAVHLAASSGYMVLPYTEYRSLMAEGTWQSRRGHPLEACHYFHVEVATSGVYVCRPEAWWSTHGQDERFRGWGMEDFAWLVAYRAVHGKDPVRVSGKVYAFDHPSAVKEGVEYDANVARLQRYAAAYDAGDMTRVMLLAQGHD